MATLELDYYRQGHRLILRDNEDIDDKCTMCGEDVETPFWITEFNKKPHCLKCALKTEKGDFLNPERIMVKIIDVVK